jgi:aminopeptidase N
LKPWFYPQDRLKLDAKGFEIHEITLAGSNGERPLDYVYDQRVLEIDLDRLYTREEEFVIEIGYTAKPQELESIIGKAITSDQGLYFIDPKNEDPQKPLQVWTQGETTSGSNWFPTIDAPNQRCTQEMLITVPDSLRTLSNGVLVYSQTNPDSTRTDYWNMDQPHAPYLFMLAIGDYEIIEEEWKGIKLQYYVEPEYKPHAKSIFGRTPLMMEYFSELLDYPFPWSKYAQVVVRDFVTGAMENTTASVFMEDVQSTSRELIDYNWDDIISHELFHQWFGDLVTCESWANITLNEAFATYGEVLWLEHYEGRTAAQYKILEDLEDYINESKTKKEDLIRFYYENPDDLFDNHSYAKGGLILNLLRSYIGDEAFFGALNHYLRKHAFQSAEVHDLRLAFEWITGEDLNWFFNQWFLSSGHPQLQVNEDYNDSTGVLTVEVWQHQDLDLHPVFRMPVGLDVWCKSRKTEHEVVVERPYTKLEIQCDREPDLVVFDNRFNLIAEIDHRKDPEAYYQQYQLYDDIRPRIEAVKYFIEYPDHRLGHEIMEQALDDHCWKIRQLALINIDVDSTRLNDRILSKIETLTRDSISLVRAEALASLGDIDREGYKQLFKRFLMDSSYMVAGTALENYLQTSADDISTCISNFEQEDNINIVLPIADYLTQAKDFDKYDWFEDKISHVGGTGLWYMIRLFGLYLIDAPEALVQRGVQKLQAIGMNHKTYYVRISAYQSLELLSDTEGVTDILAMIREREKDPRVVEYFNN